MTGRPCVDIGQVRPDNLEAGLKNMHGQSAQVLSQQGVPGQVLQLLIIVLPDANATVFYGNEHVKWQPNLIAFVYWINKF